MSIPDWELGPVQFSAVRLLRVLSRYGSPVEPSVSTRSVKPAVQERLPEPMIETTCRGMPRADVDNRAAFNEWLEVETRSATPRLDELRAWMRSRRGRK